MKCAYCRNEARKGTVRRHWVCYECGLVTVALFRSQDELIDAGELDGPVCSLGSYKKKLTSHIGELKKQLDCALKELSELESREQR
jgi:hypothetical protein